jgi:hypothetical protein
MIDANDSRLTPYEREIAAMRGDGAKLSDAQMLACCAMGLAEEAAEVQLALDGHDYGTDALAELGDLIWYAATAAHRLDLTTAQVESLGTSAPLEYDADGDLVRGLHLHTGAFAGLVKKWLFHDKPLARDVAARHLAEVFELASRIATQLGHTLDDARAANITKIRKRFPSGGFTAAEANARADEREVSR